MLGVSADVGQAKDAQGLTSVVDHAVLDGDVAEEAAGVVVGKDAEMGELAEVGAGARVGGETGLEKGGDGFFFLGVELVFGDMGDGHGSGFEIFLVYWSKNS